MNLLDHLRSLEECLLDPVVRANPAAIERLLAPDFVEFGSSGQTYTRDEILSALAAETAPSSRTLTHFRLLASTADWALVTYRITRSNSTGAVEITSLRSSTWIRREDRWQLLFHQGTPIPFSAIS